VRRCGGPARGLGGALIFGRCGESSGPKTPLAEAKRGAGTPFRLNIWGLSHTWDLDWSTLDQAHAESAQCLWSYVTRGYPQGDRS